MKRRFSLLVYCIVGSLLILGIGCGGGSSSENSQKDASVGQDMPQLEDGSIPDVDIAAADLQFDLNVGEDLGLDLAPPDLVSDLGIGDASLPDQTNTDIDIPDIAGFIDADLFTLFDVTFGDDQDEDIAPEIEDIAQDAGVGDSTLDAQNDVADTTLPIVTTIYALQDPSLALPGDKLCSMVPEENPVIVRNELVTIKNVVVYGQRHNADETFADFRFYVTEKNGGPYSGIEVLINKDDYVLLPQSSKPIDLTSELTITGQLQEHFCATRIVVRPKLPGHQIIFHGAGRAYPSPIQISTCKELESESLESVQVEFRGLVVSNHTLPDGRIEITDVLGDTCELDDEFRSGLYPFWGSSPPAPNYEDKPGVTYTRYISIWGIVQSLNGTYRLNPRYLDDLMPNFPCDDKKKNGVESDVDCGGRSVWINEIAATWEGGLPGGDILLRYFVELAGPAGMDLSGWKLVFFDVNSGTLLGSVTVENAFPLPGPVLTEVEADNGVGVLRALHRTVVKSVPTNWYKRAVALVNDKGELVQFLSTDGAIQAQPLQDGQNYNSTDIGLPLTLGSSNALSLVGSGKQYDHFVWRKQPLTQGLVNTKQQFWSMCPICAENSLCKVSEDCGELYCAVNKICTTRCNDKRTNGGESGMDCGGRTVWFNETAAGCLNCAIEVFIWKAELAGPAGLDLTGWKIRVKGTSQTLSLSGKLDQDVQNGIGLRTFEMQFESITSLTLELIDPDGTVVQAQPEGIKSSLSSSTRRIGTGNRLSDFVTASTATPSWNLINPGQTFTELCGPCEQKWACESDLDCESGSCDQLVCL